MGNLRRASEFPAPLAADWPRSGSSETAPGAIRHPRDAIRATRANGKVIPDNPALGRGVGRLGRVAREGPRPTRCDNDARSSPIGVPLCKAGCEFSTGTLMTPNRFHIHHVLPSFAKGSAAPSRSPLFRGGRCLHSFTRIRALPCSPFGLGNRRPRPAAFRRSLSTRRNLPSNAAAFSFAQFGRFNIKDGYLAPACARNFKAVGPAQS